MEVQALYDFTASGEDELSFKKGDILKILDTDDNWYKAELQGNEGYVPKNYVDACFPRWYCDDISRAEAEGSLMARSLGSFIIRSSQTSKGEFSISVRHEDDVQHFKVMRDNRGNYYLWTEKFKSLNKLVDYYKISSISRQKQIFLWEEGSHPQEKQVEKPMRDPSRSIGGAAAGITASATSHRSFTEPGRQHSEPLHTGQDCHRSLVDSTKQMYRWSQVPPHEISRTAPMHTPSQVSFSSREQSQTPTPRATRVQPSSLPQRVRMVQALYDFQAMEPDELDFHLNDLIEVLDSSDSSWWMGRLRGKVGLFPSNYVASADR